MTFGCILATINLVGTGAASWLVIFSPVRVDIIEFCIFVLLPLLLHLVGCCLLLLFEKTVHPWRQLGKERERHCWGKLQGSKREIEAEPTLWEQVFLIATVFYIDVPLQAEKEGGEADQHQRQTFGAAQVFLTDFHVCHIYNILVCLGNTC